MGYGARVRRVPALGGANLSDVDIMKVALLAKVERGFKGKVMDQIYSMNDFFLKCGGFNKSYYGAYVAQSFYDELLKEVSCEMKVLGHVADDATQATLDIYDSNTPAQRIYFAYAGRKSIADKSAFGNKIALKIFSKTNITMKLLANVSDGDTSATFDDVSNLEIGYFIKFVEGSNEEVKQITNINRATKVVSFSAISESSGFSSAATTIYRLDVQIQVAVKGDLGNYQKMETWEGPFSVSLSLGIVKEINDVDTGSNFIYLAVNGTNSSPTALKIPIELSTWTALSGGSDGTPATDSDWKNLAENYLNSQEFTILLAPESSSITHNSNMLEFCTDGYKGVYYAQAANGAGEDALKVFGASLRGAIKFGMLPSDKWIRVNDPTTIGGYLEIPKVGIDAAHWFNTYYKFGESKVAAGNKPEMVLRATGKLLDSNGLVHDDADGVGARLIRNYSINICKYTRGYGITNNSARTFSVDDGYKFQNQLFQFILYSRSIVAYLKQVEQDKAGADAQELHRNTVWTYMKKKFDAGHLFKGQKEDGKLTEFKDACIIINDFSINTLTNIANGIEEIFLQFVAPPPIEEPILSLASAGVTTVKG